MAAVLACGDGAVLSHRSAAMLWGIRPYSGSVELTVTGRAGARRSDGLRVHRSRDLPDTERAIVGGIPTTSVPRTLLDIAAMVPAHQLRRAVERANQLELFDLRPVVAVLAAHPRRPGAPALRALLDDMRRHGVSATRSNVESAFLQICIDHDLPRPRVNRYDGKREADFAWPDRGLVVEVDTWWSHGSERSFASDRSRDRATFIGGAVPVRFTDQEIYGDPVGVARELRAILDACPIHGRRRG
jgi:very-short-patch-repair endonuclease